MTNNNKNNGSRLTIKELAQAAGVSRGTVDRVLHNRSGVNAEVEARIRKIIKDLDYMPNKAGKMLAAIKQPLKIGCFLPSIGNDFFDEITRGMTSARDELVDFGVDILFKTVKEYDAIEHIAGIQELLDNGATTLCIATMDTAIIQEYISSVISSGVPVICVNTDISNVNRICYVGSDYYSDGTTVGGLVNLALPSRLEILPLTGSLSIKGHLQRITGLFDTLNKYDREYIAHSVVETFDSDDISYEKARQILVANPNINCVYVSTAGTGGVAEALEELNLRGKNKVWLIGHDDVISTREKINVGLIDFLVCQEPFRQGESAVNKMFEYMLSSKIDIPDDLYTQTVIKIKENMTS